MRSPFDATPYETSGPVAHAALMRGRGTLPHASEERPRDTNPNHERSPRPGEGYSSNVRRSPRTACAHRERGGGAPFKGGPVPPLPGCDRQPAPRTSMPDRRTRLSPAHGSTQTKDLSYERRHSGGMPEFDSRSYGKAVARTFDTLYPEVPKDDPMVQALAGWAGHGPALELGIGTGRVAIPLALRGVRVDGIDVSAEMLTRLRSKAGKAPVRAYVGDMADFRLNRSYPLIYVVFNTFFQLASAEGQANCFAAAARHLDPGGMFVLQVFFPDLTRYHHGQSTMTRAVGAGSVELECSRLDLAEQTIRQHHVSLSTRGVRMVPVELRYVWPNEMDLMARCAGLRLKGRWGGWEQEPFTSDTRGMYVVAYEKSGTPARPPSPRRKKSRSS